MEQLKKDLAYEMGSKAKERDEAYFQKLIDEMPEPIYNGIDGDGALKAEREKTGDPNARAAVNVSTKFVYENLHANDLKPEQHPDVDRMIEAMKEKNLDLLCERMGNVLETVTIPAYPVIQEIKEHMMACGAAGAMMSGSGPTVFGIFHSPVQAKAAMKDLKVNGLAKQLYLTTPYNVKR